MIKIHFFYTNVWCNKEKSRGKRFDFQNVENEEIGKRNSVFFWVDWDEKCKYSLKHLNGFFESCTCKFWSYFTSSMHDLSFFITSQIYQNNDSMQYSIILWVDYPWEQSKQHVTVLKLKPTKDSSKLFSETINPRHYIRLCSTLHDKITPSLQMQGYNRKGKHRAQN